MRLVLVRHGQSEANVLRLVTGTPDDVLSEAGTTQVAATRDTLERIGFQAAQVHTSQWTRAQQSARILAPDAHLLVDPRLGETHAGSVANLPLKAFLEQQPDFYRDHERRYPDGESHADLNHRVLAWLADLRDQEPGTVLAVTHAGPIACLMQHALGIPMERFPALLAKNASISVLDYDAASPHGRVQLFSQLPADSLRTLIGPAP